MISLTLGLFAALFWGLHDFTIRRVGGKADVAAMFALVTVFGLLPLITKKILDGLRARRVYRGHTRPKTFDYNLIAIGAGGIQPLRAGGPGNGVLQMAVEEMAHVGFLRRVEGVGAQ